MKRKIILISILFSLIVFINEPILAAAGGSIAKAITKTFWGKLLLFIIFVIFFPLIIWYYIKEYLAIKKTMNDLRNLSLSDMTFNWISLKMRIIDIFMRVQTAWDKNNIEEVSDWMDDWYWQNQKYLHLEKWGQQGQKNVVNVKKINDIKPLYVYCSDLRNSEGSRLIVSINANMQDYLIRLSDNMVVEGDKEYKDVSSVWTFIYKNGKWVLENIEDSSTSLTYAKMKNVISIIGTNHKTA
jgi:hypothetical protein